MIWGYHLVLDCKQGNKEKITDPDVIKDFSKTLVKDIEMVAYGDPIVEHFATHDKEKAGWTLVQLIETSNICCHFVDISGDFYLDVFSCQTFDNNKVIELVNKFFQPVNIKERFIERNAE
tara:strand:- start:168 stop:527 length:360 start_codon:yes stop_codon:yes gene_type:complete